MDQFVTGKFRDLKSLWDFHSDIVRHEHLSDDYRR